YRKPFNFTFDNLKAASRHVQRLRDVMALVEKAAEQDAPGDAFLAPRLEALYDKALAAMCDDLNTPDAIAAVLEGVKLINGVGTNLNGASARSAQAWLGKVNSLLGIVAHQARAAQPTAATETTDPLAE